MSQGREGSDRGEEVEEGACVRASWDGIEWNAADDEEEGTVEGTEG